MTFGGGFWITALCLAELGAYLWIANPKHRRTRAVLRAPLLLLLGLAIRLRLTK